MISGRLFEANSRPSFSLDWPEGAASNFIVMPVSASITRQRARSLKSPLVYGPAVANAVIVIGSSTQG